MIGNTLSYYRIIEKLGEGGMGVVDISTDGQRFVLESFRSKAVAQSKLTVVLEWFDELRTKVSGGNK